MSVTNREIQLYQEVTQKVSLQKVWDLLGMQPHSGQKPIVEDFDNNPNINNYVVVLGRRSGKSASTSIIALRELLVPFSSTVILAPTFRNSQVLFNEIIKHVKTLGLPVKSINKNSYVLELDNGSRLTAISTSNYESSLGTRNSLILVDETQSCDGIIEIMDRVLLPTLLDFGTKPNGTLFANCVFLGTPRNIGSEFHGLYLKEKVHKNWKSYNSPSMCNPILPREYLEQQKQILPDLVYRNEILAEFVSTGAGVFHAFDLEINLYDPSDINLSGGNFVIGLDTGYSDQTAAVLVYVDGAGRYFIHDFYQASMCTTEQHIKSFRSLEERNKGNMLDRFLDPSSAQAAHDWLTTYNYETSKAYNKVDAGLNIINNLMAPQGYDKKPKLFINKNLGEFIRQVSSITFKENVSKNNPDPFNKDHEGTHWDLVAAFRYAVASHFRREAMGMTVV